MAHCFRCDQQITFSPDQVSEKSGKLIPLDPDTGEAHDCPTNEYPKKGRRRSALPAPTIPAPATPSTSSSTFQQNMLEKFNDVQERFSEIFERFKFQQCQITALQQETKLLRQQLVANNDNDNSSTTFRDHE